MAAPSAKVEALITRLIEREKGYVDHPADRGGPTKFGITLATLSRWRKAVTSAQDVMALTEGEARQIYRQEYFYGPGFDAIEDEDLQEFVFDFGVNSGQGRAVMALQTALKHMGLYAGAIDGGFGPRSKAALAACRNVEALYYRTKCERFELMLRAVGHDSSQSVFAGGWSNRLDELEHR